jgi:hypothetical protein
LHDESLAQVALPQQTPFTQLPDAHWSDWVHVVASVCVGTHLPDAQ